MLGRVSDGAMFTVDIATYSKLLGASIFSLIRQ